MTAGALVATTALACGGPGSQLFIVERSGSLPDAALELWVNDDGTVGCGGAGAISMTSDQTIEARELARALAPDARRERTLPRGPRSLLSYRVRMEGGTISFTDTSPRLPAAYGRLIRLTRAIAREACGQDR